MITPEAHQKIPSQWKDREILREKGQFWTPGWVARAMVSYVLQSGADTVFDPAVGNGAFAEAFQAIRNGAGGRRFYGTDIDATLLTQDVFQKPWCRVEARDFIHNPPVRKFAAIVANPPYIRHHRLPPETKRALRGICARHLGVALDGRAGMHVYFLVQALSMLAPGGRLAFIVPADTCEGVFAQELWTWISSRYCIDAAVAFAPEATPFPKVDTNPLVIMARNSAPQRDLKWVKCLQADNELHHFVDEGLVQTRSRGLKVIRRNLEEALSTGLSREPTRVRSSFKLSDFASVMRGIATGANEFFWLTKKQAREIGIPDQFLITAVGRTRDVPGDILTKDTIKELDSAGRPTLLFCPDGRPVNQFPAAVQRYLAQGEKLGFHQRALIRTRTPWYKMEQRAVPPFLFAYLGRRRARFIRNEAGAIPLTGFLCIFPHLQYRGRNKELWEILNAQATIDHLPLVGKSYGAGAIKVEPRNLERLPIPDSVIAKASFAPRKADMAGNRMLFEPVEGYQPEP